MQEKVSYWDGGHDERMCADEVYIPKSLARNKQILSTIEPKRVFPNGDFANFIKPDVFGKAHIPSSLLELLGLKEKELKQEEARVEGGRSATLEASFVTIGNQEFAVNVKGCGSIELVYPSFSQNGYMPRYANKLKHLTNGRETLMAVITNRSMGYGRPFGGQNLDLALNALSNSDSVYSRQLKMRICPLASVVSIPKSYGIKDLCWQSQVPASTAYAQEIRLLPSNVRLNSEDRGIRSLCGALDQISGSEEERFQENLVRDLFEQAFISIRTLQKTDEGYSAFKLDDVDPAKDSVIAKNGNAYFADLEGVDYKPKISLEEAVKATFENLGAVLRCGIYFTDMKMGALLSKYRT